MSGIAGGVAVAAFNTAFETAGQAVFSRPESTAWREWVYEAPTDGETLAIGAAGPAPEVRKMTGTQRFTSLRQLAAYISVYPYSTDAVEYTETQIRGDKSGMLARYLADYLAAASAGGFFWKPCVDALLSNPIGIDGVSILNDSHPYAYGGGTWDNKVTTTFGQGALETGWVAMTGLRNEQGAPMGIMPTHLVVGPALEREAKDQLGLNRAVPYDTSGAPDASSSVAAAVVLENWLGGRLKLIVEPRFADGTHDNDWLLMDLSKPGVRPVIAGVLSQPEAMVITEGSAKRDRDANQYLVRGRAAIGGYMPHCVYGKLS